jgi:tRNA(adenine34) deaminase
LRVPYQVDLSESSGKTDILDKTGPSFMEIALGEARAAGARGEVPVGAVIVRDGKLIAQAGNRSREMNDPTAHAEVLVIRAACQVLENERLTGCDLYVTLEPCVMCAGAISFARLGRLYFGAAELKGGAVENGPRFFSQQTCHHAPEVYSGIQEAEAATILRDFFKSKRD